MYGHGIVRGMTTCATHGSQGCPAFCTGALQGVADVDPDADKGPASGDVTPTPDAGQGHAAESQARELTLALSDVAEVRARLAAARSQVADLHHALEYVQQGIANADELLVKYEAASKS